MNSVTCLDLTTNKTFTLYFNDLEKQRKFLIKCRYSKKLKVLDYSCLDSEESEYLSYYI